MNKLIASVSTNRKGPLRPKMGVKAVERARLVLVRAAAQRDGGI